MFTDGSCEGNPGPGGWAFVWVEDDRIVVEENGCEPDTTNNRMELRALIEAYRYLPQSTAYLPEAGELLAMLSKAGFGQLAKHRLMLGAAQILTGVRAARGDTA